MDNVEVVEEVIACETCKVPLKFHPVYFACDELMGWFCNDCWPAVRCEELHGEGCETVVFNCPMDGTPN